MICNSFPLDRLGKYLQATMEFVYTCKGTCGGASQASTTALLQQKEFSNTNSIVRCANQESQLQHLHRSFPPVQSFATLAGH